MKCFRIYLLRFCALRLLPACLLFCFIMTNSGCVSPDAVNRIEQNTDKIVITNKGTFDILTEVNKTNEKVLAISEQVNNGIDDTEKRESELPQGIGLLLTIVLGLLGLKNGGQIIGFAKAVMSQFLKKKKGKK